MGGGFNREYWGGGSAYASGRVCATYLAMRHSGHEKRRLKWNMCRRQPPSSDGAKKLLI
jgi:hypothetical protein